MNDDDDGETIVSFHFGLRSTFNCVSHAGHFPAYS